MFIALSWNPKAKSFAKFVFGNKWSDQMNHEHGMERERKFLSF